jgi:hypothetical protein
MTLFVSLRHCFYETLFYEEGTNTTPQLLLTFFPPKNPLHTPLHLDRQEHAPVSFSYLGAQYLNKLVNDGLFTSPKENSIGRGIELSPGDSGSGQ